MDLLEKMYEQYKLSEEEYNEIENSIIEIMLFGKTPSEQPTAIIDIGPPGSGKTGLNGYALRQFENDNLIIVNNDEFKPFHPRAGEIAISHPECYIKVTNEASKRWTDSLMDRAIEGKYNVLYEGTGRKIEILKRMIAKMQGYKIIVRAMAVNDLNCLMSIVERYEGQVREKGWGRIVSASTFYKAYDREMLDTIEVFQKEGIVDLIEVYVRGKVPTEPKRIYSSDKREFPSAKLAILKGRKDDAKIARKYYEEVFSKRTLSYSEIPEEEEILTKIRQLYQENYLEER